MYHWRTPILPAAIALTCLLLSPALANRGGAQGGWNGSVDSSGNCMRCHGTRAGDGSVTVSGAPTSYAFDQIYNLTVRVEDPDQLGAGFQISVEDADGIHVGTLMITDGVNTQFAQGNEGWVTHKSAGVDNAVAGWAAMGNAADYHLQWQAPEADVGEIMFYLAGNAINDDHVEFGEQDTIYLHAQSATAACSDGEQNNGEAGIDCGGPCPDCECLADADCDDGDDCTENLCRDNQCVDTEIVPCCRNNLECDDTNPCTSDTCENLSCANQAITGCCLADVECDDGNDCTEDRCSAQACVSDAIPNCCIGDADCDDDVFCNGAEACQADRCEPGTGPCPGQRCDEATGSCVDCLVDADCDDDNPCTDDVCAGGACGHDGNEGECDDGDACTAADQCVNGVCAGILVEECCATDDECDDGDECTDDTCDTNACRHDPIPDCPASDDDDEPPPGDDDNPDPTGDGSEQPLPDDDSPTPPPPRRALCGLFGMITFPALIFGLIGMRSRRRGITIVGLRRRL